MHPTSVALSTPIAPPVRVQEVWARAQYPRMAGAGAGSWEGLAGCGQRRRRI